MSTELDGTRVPVIYTDNLVGEDNGLLVSVFNGAGVVLTVFHGTEVVVGAFEGTGVDCSGILFQRSSTIWYEK